MLTVGGGGDGEFAAWLHPPERHYLGKTAALSASIWSSVGETQPQVFLGGAALRVLSEVANDS